MRVTGGRAKGRRLAAFKGLDIRPTSDLVRGAIFNLIGQNLEGAKVVDLFAGSGSQGIEALSRGASWAFFVDNSQRSLDLVKKNLSLCGFDGMGFTLKRDLSKGIGRRPFLGEEKIDLVFIDPPYDKGWVAPLLSDLSTRELLAASSLVVAETRKNEILPEAMGRLRLVKSRTYGETQIHIFNCEGDG